MMIEYFSLDTNLNMQKPFFNKNHDILDHFLKFSIQIFFSSRNNRVCHGFKFLLKKTIVAFKGTTCNAVKSSLIAR